jgi:hypothetical protein
MLAKKSKRLKGAPLKILLLLAPSTPYLSSRIPYPVSRISHLSSRI